MYNNQFNMPVPSMTGPQPQPQPVSGGQGSGATATTAAAATPATVAAMKCTPSPDPVRFDAAIHNKKKGISIDDDAYDRFRCDTGPRDSFEDVLAQQRKLRKVRSTGVLAGKSIARRQMLPRPRTLVEDVNEMD